MVRELGGGAPIGVFLNLDHFTVDEMSLIAEAIREGLVSSVMIDASKERFDENVRISREVVRLARAGDVLVEAELGKIKGVEDEIASAEAFYTDPKEAVDFVRATGADLLAVSIGTQHGVSKGKDVVLKTALAAEIRDRLAASGVPAPLVLHGTSGLLPEQIREVIGCGICKLNKDTRYQYEFSRAAWAYYAAHRDAIVPPDGVPDDASGLFSGSDWTPEKKAFDPRAMGRAVQERIRDAATGLLEQAGSGGKSLFGGEA
jgi:fructose-bisphosphate aldolase, class II